MKVALLGAGGFRTPLTIDALQRASAHLDMHEVALYDIDASRLRTMHAVVESMQSPHPGPHMKVSMTTDLTTAVRGASFVLCAIRVGGLGARVVDERVALEAGLVGQETVGAGGLCLLMRSVPIMRRLAEQVSRTAPNAWFINFSNPVGAISGLLRETLGDRAIGVCDTPVALFRRVAEVLGRKVDDLGFDYFGLNHLGWLRSVFDHDHNLLPDLLADDTRLAQLEEAQLFGLARLRELRMIPVEYLTYYYSPERHRSAVADAGYSRAEYLQRQQERFYSAASLPLWLAARAERDRSYLSDAGMSRSEPAADADGYATVAVDVLESLQSNMPARMVVDVANGEALACLPPQATVEVPCTVDMRGARPCRVDAPPQHASILMQQVYAAEQGAMLAVRNRSRADAAAALALHPLVGSCAERVFTAYLQHHTGLAAQFA